MLRQIAVEAKDSLNEGSIEDFHNTSRSASQFDIQQNPNDSILSLDSGRNSTDRRISQMSVNSLYFEEK